MFLDSQILKPQNPFYVCGEIFKYRDYQQVFLCDTEQNKFLAYFNNLDDIKYLDYLKLYDYKLNFKSEKSGYYKVLEVQAELNFNGYQIISSQNSLLGMIYEFKNNFKKFVLKNFNDPFANLLLGILFGDRSGYSKFLSEDLRYVGLTHLVAVSGMNVALTLGVFRNFTWILGRRLAFVLNGIFVILFAYFTSLTTSVLRACLMSLINLYAEYHFLRLDSLKVLFFTAYALLLINPYFIVYDLSYALSFVATLAILSIKKTELLLNDLKLEIQTNLACFWYTLPILLIFFKTLPLFTVFSNILVMYPASYLLYLGLLLILSYFLNFEILSKILFYLLDLIAFYFFKIVDLTKSMPLMTIFIDNLWMRLILIFVIFTIFYFFLRQKFNFLKVI